MTPAFAKGLERLRALAGAGSCAVMCAEALWWRCHRRIIADYLIAAGDDVQHIMPDGKTVEARMTPGAQAAHGVLVYREPAGLP